MLAALLPTLAGASAAPASESVEADRPVGHPRARFPLAVHLAPPPHAWLEAPVRRAVDAWNAVFQEALGLAAFRWHDRPDGADVIIRFVPPGPGVPLGLAHVEADAAGVIAVPVLLELLEPSAMGETSRETVLFQVAAHEIGHALGLPHTSDAASIMCCRRGAVDLADPAVRARYVEARRRPEVRSALAEIRALYPRFWAP